MLVACLASAVATLLLVAAVAGATTPKCTDTWTGGSSGVWQEPGNWSTGKVPGASSVACIDSGSTVTVTADENEVGTVLDEGSLGVAAGSLKIVGTTASKTVGLSLGGGTLEVSGTLKVSKAFEDTQFAELAGGGTVDLEKGATGSIAASATLHMSQVTLENNGTFTVEHEGDIDGREGVKFINNGTLMVNGAFGREGECELVNNKTLEKTEGSWTSEVRFAIDNEGTVSTTAGVLKFSEGGGTSGKSHTDVWKAEGAGTGIEFGYASYSLGAAATVSGEMSVAYRGVVSVGVLSGAKGQVVVNGELAVERAGSSLESLVVGEGDLVADGELAVSKSLALQYSGYVEGAGRVVLGSGGTGSAVGTSYLSGVTLENNGTFTVEHEGDIDGREGAKFINNGTLMVNGAFGREGECELVNNKTLEKTEGSWSSNIDFTVDNEGTVSTTAGVLSFVEGGGTSGKSHTDVWKAEGAGTGIDFGYANYYLGSAPEMSGSLEVSGEREDRGDVEAGRFEGAITSLVLSYGTLKIGGSLSTPLEALIVGSGSLYIGGQVKVAGTFNWEGEGTVNVGELVLGPKSKIGTGLGYSQSLTGDVVNGPGDVVVWDGGGLRGSDVSFTNEGTFEVDVSSPFEDPTVMEQGGGAIFFNDGAITSVGGGATMGWTYVNAGSLPGELAGRECVITEPEDPPTPSRGFYAIGEAGNLEFVPEEGKACPPDITPGPDDWRCEEVE